MCFPVKPPPPSTLRTTPTLLDLRLCLPVLPHSSFPILRGHFNPRLPCPTCAVLSSDTQLEPLHPWGYVTMPRPVSPEAARGTSGMLAQRLLLFVLSVADVVLQLARSLGTSVFVPWLLSHPLSVTSIPQPLLSGAQAHITSSSPWCCPPRDKNSSRLRREVPGDFYLTHCDWK